ncbi:MAG: ATPase, T2SS/T4P/T4SS family [Phycisphaerales bacterium]
MMMPLSIASGLPSTLAADGYFLVSPYKPILFLAPLVVWAWVVATILDKDAARWYFKREQWNFAHLLAGLVAAGIVLFAPASFWITWPIMLVILTADIGIYATLRNKDDRVPEVFRWSLDFEKMAKSRAAKAASKKARQVTMSFRPAGGKDLPVPEKDSPQYAVRAHAETIIQNLFESRGNQIEVVPTRDKQYRVLFSIDGLRQPVEQLPAAEGAAIIDFFKAAAGLDIEDRRRKQKSMMTISQPNTTARVARVSAMGGSAGMQLNLLLDPEQQVKRRVEELGLFPNQLEDLKTLVEEQAGVVLVSAPRHNGGTTTLYALIRAHDAYTSNVQTVELDPQTQIEGVRHNQFDPEDAAEYSTTVRSVLRRDPNVVGIAECDDATAKEIARADTRSIRVYVQVPVDGAVNAIQAWSRAVNDPKAASNCLHGVVAQRLVRKLCTNCRVPYQPTPDVLKKLGLPPETKQLFRKGGQVLIKDKPDTCPVCAGSGFNGQIGLFAIHTLDPEDRNLIRANNVEGLKASFRQKKQQSIQTSGLQRVMLGDTSVEELVRVIQGPAESKKKKPSPTEQSAGAAS